MQEYFRASRLREVLDAAGFRCAAAACLGWFVFLWGLTPRTLAAGAALFLLLTLLLRATRKGRLRRREEKLRRQIGSEPAVGRLLMSEPERAHFETAMLLSLRLPLTLPQSGPGRRRLRSAKGKGAFVLSVSAAKRPGDRPGRAANAADGEGPRRAALHPVRALRHFPGSAVPGGERRNRRVLPFLPREELTALLGQSNPVSDAQLMALGQRRKKKKPMILNQRARRYAAYGALLLGLYTLSGLMYYAVPGLICVGLASACRCVRSPEDSLLRG